jgi:hypothetical protein
MAYTCEKGLGVIENVPSINTWSISAAQAPNDSRPNIMMLRKYKHILYCLSQIIVNQRILPVHSSMIIKWKRISQQKVFRKFVCAPVQFVFIRNNQLFNIEWYWWRTVDLMSGPFDDFLNYYLHLKNTLYNFKIKPLSHSCLVC